MFTKLQLLEIANNDFNPSIVDIDDDAIRQLVTSGAPPQLIDSGIKDKPVSRSLEDAITYILMLDSINFRFWDLVDGDAIGIWKLARYSYEGVTGALGARAAFDKAWGDDPTPATFWKNYDSKGVIGIFGRSMPAIAERETILSSLRIGQHRESPWYVSIMLADSLKYGAYLDVGAASWLSNALPVAFQDRYLKKAQLALAEIASFAKDLGIDAKPNFTLFADYQLPRVMRSMGVLVYSPQLADKVDGQGLIEKDSPEENAIRGATLLAGEKMARHLGCSVAALDNYLWTNRKLAGDSLFHLTLTTSY